MAGARPGMNILATGRAGLLVHMLVYIAVLAVALGARAAANDPVTPAELRNLTKCCHWSERLEQAILVHGEMGKFFPMPIARLPHAHLAKI